MDEAVNIALNRVEGIELTAAEQQTYNEAMKVVYEKSWHLANYVKSLAPEARPEPAIGKNVLRSQYLQGALPGMEDAAWDTLQARHFPLVGQVVIEPRQFNPTIDSVDIKSFYNDTEVAFLFTWDDRTHTTGDETDETTGKPLEDAVGDSISGEGATRSNRTEALFLMGWSVTGLSLALESRHA